VTRQVDDRTREPGGAKVEKKRKMRLLMTCPPYIRGEPKGRLLVTNHVGGKETVKGGTNMRVNGGEIFKPDFN